MRSLIALSILSLLTACGSPESQKQAADAYRAKQISRYQVAIDRSIYLRDARTGLCFNVMRYDQSVNPSHTQVDCDKVEKMLNR